MAQIATNTADKATIAARNATANVAEAGKRTSDQTAEVRRETAGQAANAVRDGLRVVRQAADAAAEVEEKTVRHAGAGMAELNRALVDLLQQQTRDNVQLVQALAKLAKWRQAAQLQSEFLRASLQRTAQFTQRYVEVGQAVMTSALSTAQSQARKADCGRSRTKASLARRSSLLRQSSHNQTPLRI